MQETVEAHALGLYEEDIDEARRFLTRCSRILALHALRKSGDLLTQ